MSILQETGKGTSNGPMIAGVIGFVASIPGTICAGICGAGVDLFSAAATQGEMYGAGTTWIIINVAVALSGLVFGIMSKSRPRLSGFILILASILGLIITIITLNWFWGLITVASFLIGGIISLTQEKISTASV